MRTKNKEQKIILYYKQESQELLKHFLNKKCDLKAFNERLKALKDEAENDLLSMNELGFTPLREKIFNYFTNASMIATKDKG